MKIETDTTKDTFVKMNPNWIAGFTSAEGCFIISIVKSTSLRIGYQVQLKFLLTQHDRDLELFNYLVEFLGYGYVCKYANRNAVDFIVTKFSDIVNKLLPLFQKYPIVGYKYLDFLYFVKIVQLMENKAHLRE